MKIVLNSMDEVIDFVRGLHPSLLAMAGHGPTPAAAPQEDFTPRVTEYADAPKATVRMVDFGGLQLPVVPAADEPDGLPQDIQSPVGPTDTVSTVQVDNPVDASGRRWDERIDSSSKEVTGKGLWRARRNVPDDVRAAVLAELSAQPDQASSEDAEPLVTETHALPVEEPEAAVGADTEVEDYPEASQPQVFVPIDSVDYAALIAASQEAALDASDSHAWLVEVCKGFISAYGHAAFAELRKHVAPKDDASGKSIQQFTPSERRLLQACIANYLQFA